jgi:beta-lactam-binding protein with PASTA domain
VTTQARAPGRPKRRPWVARQDWYFAVALALFVGVGVWFSRAISDFFAPAQKTVSIPTLVGQTLGDAVATADRAHIKTAVLRRTPSDRYPKDVVMRQSPAAGSQVREGRQISLVVSTGVQIFAMPDLRYESLREVGLDLSHYKLVLGKTRTVPNDEVPGGRVVTQDPPPLSSVRSGSTVTVEISKGGAQTIRVPSLERLTIDEARAAAKSARLHIGQIVWTPFGRYGAARGVVVRQKPAAGTQIDESQLVSLQVSAGPREAGYLVRQIHALATVPEDAASQRDKSPIVRVQVRDETGTWNVYNAYAQPKQRLDFNLTVVGTAELDVFVNEELISSTKLGHEPAMQERQQLGPPPPHASPSASTQPLSLTVKKKKVP